MKVKLSAINLLLLCLVLVPVQASLFPSPLVDTGWLAQHREQVVILDVRDKEDSFEKAAEVGKMPVNPCGAGKKAEKPFIVSGHIPGAILVLQKNITAERKTDKGVVKGVLPSKEDFEQLMQKSGVSNDSAIVISHLGTSPKEVVAATRLYWTLKYFGHPAVAILNGGTAQWVKDERAVEYGKSQAAKGNFKVTEEHKEFVATAAEVLQLIQSKTEQLIDVREMDAYLGLTYAKKYVQPNGKGHIPTAKNFPISFMVDTLSPVASLYSKDQVLAVAKLVNLDTTKPTVAYCNAGAQASLAWFVWHELLGQQNIRLYDGSMSDWSLDTNRPVTAMKIE